MNKGETEKPCIYFAIGLMSGSAFDGLDIAYCTYQKRHILPEKWDHAVIISETVPYPKELLERLKQADQMPAVEFVKLDWDLGYWTADQVQTFIAKYEIKRIDVIGSHGHSVFHNPNDGYSVQLGRLACIAAKVKNTVVGDFRSLDIALGGQGAPLAPVGDRMLFEKYTFCLNIGGIANITYTDPLNQQQVQAFDICVCNQLLNYFGAQVNESGYDNEGGLAKQGQVNQELLDRLNQLEYHQVSPPKTLSNQYLREIVLPIFEEEQFAGLPIETKLATSVQMIVDQVTKVIETVQKTLSQNELANSSVYMPKFQKVVNEIAELMFGEDEIPKTFNIEDNREHMKLLVSGGGVYNTFLLERLRNSLQNDFGVELEIQELQTKCKKAMICGFLAILRLRREVNVMKSVTGASQSTIGGCIYYHYDQ